MARGKVTPAEALEEGRALVCFLGRTVDLLMDRNTDYARELLENREYTWGMCLCFIELERLLADGLEAATQGKRGS